MEDFNKVYQELLKQNANNSQIKGNSTHLKDVNDILSNDPKQPSNIADNKIHNSENNKQQDELSEKLFTNNIDQVIACIEKGANLDLQEKYGETALIRAISCENYKIVELLIEKGANLDLQDDYGRTALIKAIFYVNYNIVELLIEKGANLDLQDKDGETALMIAIDYNNYKIAELLIEKGANLALKDKAKFDALYYAKQSEEKTIIKLIEDKLKKQNKDIEKIY